MNIVKFAMQMEKEGETFYRQLAEKTVSSGLKTIFNWLAAEEAGHFNAFAAMNAGLEPALSETNLLQDANVVFSKMKPSDGDLLMVGSQEELYRQARDMEKKSLNFYQERAREAADDRHRELFERLAREENKHYFLLENIIEFVARPQTWLENAEFSRLET